MQAALIGPAGQIILGTSNLTAGRLQSNQFVVCDPRVSAHHAVVNSHEEGTFTITDRGSTNGTFVNGLMISFNVPQLLQSGDVIRIGDTFLTFQISDVFQTSSDDVVPFADPGLMWNQFAANQPFHVRQRPDGYYHPKVLPEEQVPPEIEYVMSNSTKRLATGWPPQKIDENLALKRTPKLPQHAVTSSTQGHRRMLVTLLLASFILMGVIAFSVFAYLNYLKRPTPARTLGVFCSAFRNKDYESVYSQMSSKLQRLGTEKMIAENFASAKINFAGLSGQVVNGTMILQKDSSNTWKIDDLLNI